MPSRRRSFFLLPAERRCNYTGKLTDPRETQQAEAQQRRGFAPGTGAEGRRKDGRRGHHHQFHAARTARPRRVPLAHAGLRLELPQMGQPGAGPGGARLICISAIWEFLAHRLGGLAARDERSWFESKQPCSPALLVELAREAAQLIPRFKRAPKKVLVLDLDNTLWGGVVADDGLEGIELGDTSPRGEAFKAFQKYIASLKQRGVLLAVCSKNDLARAAEPFEKHPDMVLRMEDIVSFKANWEPKSENIRAHGRRIESGPGQLCVRG